MYRTLILLTIFSVAMGFMESAVVVYLRELYYPGGFSFPLVEIPLNIAIVEIIREAATIIMLVIIGYIAGKNLVQRFSFFLLCFAVWDLFYYIFLKAFLDWPESLFTWDILFLIPVPWTGPVIAPCLLCLTMIAFALLTLYFENKGIKVFLKKREWTLLITGASIIILSFIWDYLTLSGNTSANEALFTDLAHYIPQSFNWPLFLVGEAMVVVAMVLMTYKRVRD